MYQVTVTGKFASAHNIREHGGKCERLHGHNWKVQAVVCRRELSPLGMVIDFRILREKLGEITAILDHYYINELPQFAEINPTSENLAAFIFAHLAEKLHPVDPELQVKRVSVEESEGSIATYEAE